MVLSDESVSLCAVGAIPAEPTDQVRHRDRHPRREDLEALRGPTRVKLINRIVVEKFESAPLLSNGGGVASLWT